MKKASKIVLTIGAIFKLLFTIAIVITGLVLIIVALVDRTGIDPEIRYSILEMLEEWGVEGVDPDTIDWIVAGIYCCFVLLYSSMAFVLYLVATILGFAGTKAKKNGILIANIVFSFLATPGLLILAGSVLGIVGLSMEKKKAEASQEEPVKEVEQK